MVIRNMMASLYSINYMKVMYNVQITFSAYADKSTML